MHQPGSLQPAPIGVKRVSRPCGRTPVSTMIPLVREVSFHNRRAVQIENESIRVTVTVEGGHIAEILDRKTGINPLWVPPWPSIEPSSFSVAGHSIYGDNCESKLLSG